MADRTPVSDRCNRRALAIAVVLSTFTATIGSVLLASPASGTVDTVPCSGGAGAAG